MSLAIVCENEEIFNKKNNSKLDNNKLSNIFHLGAFKGKGSFGQVHEIRFDNKFIAAKKIKIQKESLISSFIKKLKMMKNEINILSILGTGEDKEFFPQFHGCTLDGGVSSGEALFFVLQETLESDFKNEKTCNNFIERYTTIERIQKYRDLAMGLVKMHRLNLVHEDLKPENIMTKDGDFSILKIIDFGMACYTNENVFGGSPLFNSPEKIKSLKGSGRCDPAHDIWALGLTIAVIEGKRHSISKDLDLSCFKLEFTINCYFKLMSNFNSVIDVIFGKSNTFTLLLKKMMSFDSKDRPSAIDIVNIIDSMSAGEKSNQFMSSKINHRNNFKIKKKFTISDIGNPEINYNINNKEKNNSINQYKKDSGQINLNTHNKINNHETKIISEQTASKKDELSNKNIIIIFAVFILIGFIIISTFILKEYFRSSNS